MSSYSVKAKTQTVHFVLDRNNKNFRFRIPIAFNSVRLVHVLLPTQFPSVESTFKIKTNLFDQLWDCATDQSYFTILARPATSVAVTLYNRHPNLSGSDDLEYVDEQDRYMNDVTFTVYETQTPTSVFPEPIPDAFLANNRVHIQLMFIKKDKPKALITEK